jgi:alkanesulfonate monooxygenase SsuD/methylene tetrahydromethanopterin reductase-like flavin-dependent oxidoreductase (luciferase family)
MKYGFVFPFGDAMQMVDWAKEAEQTGWDGFFVADLVWGLEAWVALGAAALQTERIRLGTMLTPMPWVSPWKLASQTATLDQLSNGRTILAVGLGANDTGAGNYGLPTDRKVKAELMDEGLAIVTELWKGKSIQYEGRHYHLSPTDFPPPAPPVQQPRIPIWVVGAWPKQKSMARVLGYDGMMPMTTGADGKIGQAGPEAVKAIRAYVDERRTLKTPFEIVVEGQTSGEDKAAGRETVRMWEESGATWWIESLWGQGEDVVLKRLKEGPPRV